MHGIPLIEFLGLPEMEALISERGPHGSRRAGAGRPAGYAVSAQYIAQRGTAGWTVVSTGNGEVVGQYGLGAFGAEQAKRAATALNRDSLSTVPRGTVHGVRIGTNPALTPAALKIWRRKHHITQGELATLLGVHISTTHRWEQGDVPIPVWLRLALEGLERRQELIQP